MYLIFAFSAIFLASSFSIPYCNHNTFVPIFAASFAMLGDITIAERGSTIGFAGKRVIQDTIKESLPEGFQTAEYLQEHGGCIDLVVERKDLRDTIGTLLSILLKKNKSEVTTENANIDEVTEPLQKTSEAV